MFNGINLIQIEYSNGTDGECHVGIDCQLPLHYRQEWRNEAKVLLVCRSTAAGAGVVQ